MVHRSATSSLRLLLIGMLLVTAGLPGALLAICQHDARPVMAIASRAQPMDAASHYDSCCAHEARPANDATGLASTDAHMDDGHRHSGHTGFCCESQPCDAVVSTDAVQRGDRDVQPDLQPMLNLLATFTARQTSLASHLALVSPLDRAIPPPTAEILPTFMLLV